MLLRDRKRIKNGLPGFYKGFDGMRRFPGVQISRPDISWTPGMSIPDFSKQFHDETSNLMETPKAPFGPISSIGVGNNPPEQSNKTPFSTKLKNFGNGLIDNAPNILSAGLGFAQTMNQAGTNNIYAQDMINSAKTTGHSVGGFGYDVKTVDSQPFLDQAHQQVSLGTFQGAAGGAGLGAAVGSVAGPIGGAIGAVGGALFGGLFGHSQAKEAERKAEEQARKAKKFIKGRNIMAQSDAYTKFLQSEQDKNDNLMYANNGKDANKLGLVYTIAKHVYTSDGVEPEGVADAKVAKGESIVDNIDDLDNIQATVVKDGKFGKDTEYANLKPSTVVFGKEFQDLALPHAAAIESVNKNNSKLRGNLGKVTDDLIKKEHGKALLDLAQQQELYHLEQNMKNYITQYAKHGKDALPGFVGGISPWSNIISHGLGGMFSIGQYNLAKNQEIYTPDINARNQYEGEALNTMRNLRINPYPILSRLLLDERQALYRNINSGGLRGAQKQMANIATALGSQRNRANTMSAIQQQNNSYLENYAKMAMEAGIGNANRRMEANKFAEEMYARAHAARQQGMQMGIYNLLNNIQQFSANEYKRQQGNRMTDLYQQQINNNKKKIANDIGDGKTDTPKGSYFSSFANTWNFGNGSYNFANLFNTPKKNRYGYAESTGR